MDSRSATFPISQRWLRPAAIGISVVLVVVAAVLATQNGGGDGETLDTTPHFAAAADLIELEDSLGHGVYWAGERPPAQLELTEEASGSIYLRYLPPGAEAGDPRPQFLTVGTYPFTNAADGLRLTASKAGAKLEDAPGGGVLYVNPSSETSVYLAYPGSDLQIEVYDPTPGRALELIRSGAIGPVG
ncbi:MAG TPA: hypothetical protein VFI03_00075 [Solirubrobacterales bacterium]|nr:hypothetical protein [Solirubrobacterales bacterium]